MLARLIRLIRPSEGFNHSHVEFFDEFLSHAPNGWISTNARAHRAFQRFFAHFPSITLQKISDKNLYFVLCSGEMSAAIHYESDAGVILIFPDLYRNLISADPYEAYAILAHEIGHILHDHYQRGTSSIEAQIEADAFACSLGFREPIRALLERDNNEESQIRLSVINSNFALNHEKSA